MNVYVQKIQKHVRQNCKMYFMIMKFFLHNSVLSTASELFI